MNFRPHPWLSGPRNSRAITRFSRKPERDPFLATNCFELIEVGE